MMIYSFIMNTEKKCTKRSVRLKLNLNKGYVYSGLTFLLYPQIVQNISGKGYNEYLRENFYDKLGAPSLTFNPWQKYPLSQIVPTEYDSLIPQNDGSRLCP